MALLGNIIWFFLGGWALFLLYALGAVIFFPMFIPLFRLALFALWPFGRDVVTRAELDRFRQARGLVDDSSMVDATLKNVSAVLNLLWMLTFGWVLALAHLLASFFNLCLFFLIVTIPNIGGTGSSFGWLFCRSTRLSCRPRWLRTFAKRSPAPDWGSELGWSASPRSAG